MRLGSRTDICGGWTVTRDDVVSLALSCDGWRWPDLRYVEFLMPAAIESAATRAALANMSSCALFVRALWRHLGCAHPILAAPYRVGHAVSDVIQIARDAGAWHGTEGTPGLGDVVLVGKEGHEHVYVVTGLDATHGDGMHVESVDGGQGLHGAAIERRTRLWPTWADRWRDVNDLGSDRPVRGWAESLRVAIGFA